MIFEILDDMATKAVKKTEGQITGAAKKIVGNWFSDVTGKTYYNTTRAKAEQYETASERMKRTPSSYRGWTKEGRKAADMGVDITDTSARDIGDELTDEQIARFTKMFEGETTEEESLDYDTIPDYIKYEDLPRDLINRIHDDSIPTDDPVKGQAVRALGSEGWDGINVASLKNDILANFELLEFLSKYF